MIKDFSDCVTMSWVGLQTSSDQVFAFFRDTMVVWQGEISCQRSLHDLQGHKAGQNITSRRSCVSQSSGW